MTVHAHPVTLVCRGWVAAVDRCLVTVRIGAALWDLVLPEDYKPRPEVGQYVQVLAIPSGGDSPEASKIEPLMVAVWSKVRAPANHDKSTAQTVNYSERGQVT